MSTIKFKATRKMHDSGYRLLDKSGELEYDLMANDRDAIWITITEPQRILIDCNKDGTYNVKFDKTKAYLHSPEVRQQVKEKS